ncbi:hypothetical protein ACU4GR_22985 [Methylobacterium oryzae CBMB20]
MIDPETIPANEPSGAWIRRVMRMIGAPVRRDLGRPGQDQARIGIRAVDLEFRQRRQVGPVPQAGIARQPDIAGLIGDCDRADAGARDRRVEHRQASEVRVQERDVGAGREARGVLQGQVVDPQAVADAFLDHCQQVRGVAARVVPGDVAQIETEIDAEQR